MDYYVDIVRAMYVRGEITVAMFEEAVHLIQERRLDELPWLGLLRDSWGRPLVTT